MESLLRCLRFDCIDGNLVGIVIESVFLVINEEVLYCIMFESRVGIVSEMDRLELYAWRNE